MVLMGGGLAFAGGCPIGVRGSKAPAKDCSCIGELCPLTGGGKKEGRLVVYINKEGLPTSIEVEKSSGFYLLDRAAVKAVWKWQFVPAKRGRISVDSKVRVPVQFRIGGRWN